VRRPDAVDDVVLGLRRQHRTLHRGRDALREQAQVLREQRRHRGRGLERQPERAELAPRHRRRQLDACAQRHHAEVEDASRDLDGPLDAADGHPLVARGSPSPAG
jgi:hypothetical protein